MTSVGVKGVSELFNAKVSTTSTHNNGSESFDDTLNSVRTEKKDNNFNDENSTKKTENSNAERMNMTSRKEQVKPEKEVTEEQIAAVSDEVVAQIKEVLMEKYDLSEEELNVTLEALQMTDMDLLNTKDITRLVMSLEGVESQAEMLTNQDFANNLKDILANVEEIKAKVKPEDLVIPVDEQPEIDESERIQLEKDEKNEVNIDVEDDANEESLRVVDNKDADSEVTQKTSENAQTVQTTEQTSTEGNESEEMLKQNDSGKNADTKSNVDTNSDNLMVQPQDFAAKLTEDLADRVGEAKANDIVRQVVEQAQVLTKQGVTSMEMQLYPEHLGKVLIQVTTHDGTVTAQITAESEAAKNALESQLTLLKENLNNQGVKIESVEVTIASHAFEQNMQGENHGEQQAEQSRRNRRANTLFVDGSGEDEVPEEEKQIMELKGSTVSYTA